MNRRTTIAIAAASLLGVAAVGIGVAASSGDDDRPITGPALAPASAAAIEHTGGGRVTDTEVGDEESIYEVEVTLEDGRQVDGQLDKDFNVVGSETDNRDQD